MIKNIPKLKKYVRIRLNSLIKIRKVKGVTSYQI